MVAGLHGLVHLAHTAAVARKVSVASRCAASAGPAELVSAKVAGHVVAALVFLDFRFAAGTKTDLVFVFNCPGLQVFTQGLLAAQALVPHLSAFEANFSLAFCALQLCSVEVWRADVTHTTLLRTESQQRVCLLRLLLFEPLILGQELRLRSQDLSDFLSFDGYLAVKVKALNFFDLCLRNDLRKLRKGAVEAESVHAIQNDCANVGCAAFADLVCVADGAVLLLFNLGFVHDRRLLLFDDLLSRLLNLSLHVSSTLQAVLPSEFHVLC